MRVEFVCNDGSPMGITPETLYTRGVGGAEYALITVAQELAKLGCEVRVYNDPPVSRTFDGVEWLFRAAYAPDWADVTVVFRSPSIVLHTSKAKAKVFWSCDQYTTGDYRKDVFPYVDLVVCISPYHMEYFRKTYGLKKRRMTYIDIPVRLGDLDEVAEQKRPQRVTRRALFASVPDRGLPYLRMMWKDISARVKDIELYITSDYRLWGAPAPMVDKHRQMWQNFGNVHYMGALPRMEYVELLLTCDVLIYPCIYDELFCVTVAEAQCAGVVPFTSGAGALPTTNEWGFVLDGLPTDRKWLDDFRDLVVYSLTSDYNVVVDGIRDGMVRGARKRFDPRRIAEQWKVTLEGLL